MRKFPKTQKEIKPQHFFINCGTYPFEILFFVNTPEKKIKQKLSKFFDAKIIGEIDLCWDSSARTHFINNKNIFIQLNRYHKNCLNCDSVLAHEIFHAVEFLFEKIGIKHSSETSEAWAYQISIGGRKVKDRYWNTLKCFKIESEEKSQPQSEDGNYTHKHELPKNIQEQQKQTHYEEFADRGEHPQQNPPLPKEESDLPF